MALGSLKLSGGSSSAARVGGETRGGGFIVLFFLCSSHLFLQKKRTSEEREKRESKREREGKEKEREEKKREEKKIQEKRRKGKRGSSSRAVEGAGRIFFSKNFLSLFQSHHFDQASLDAALVSPFRACCKWGNASTSVYLSCASKKRDQRGEKEEPPAVEKKQSEESARNRWRQNKSKRPSTRLALEAPPSSLFCTLDHHPLASSPPPVRVEKANLPSWSFPLFSRSTAVPIPSTSKDKTGSERAGDPRGRARVGFFFFFFFFFFSISQPSSIIIAVFFV